MKESVGLRFSGYQRQIDELVIQHIIDQKKIEDLLATLRNALVSLVIMKMPKLDNNVATNADILKIMEKSFVAAIAACEK